MPEEPKIRDDYKNCDNGCTHDTVRGVLTAELTGPDDGPYDAVVSLKTPVPGLMQLLRAATTN